MPKGSSQALWRQHSAPQGHLSPSPHPQLSLQSPGLYQAASNEQGHPLATRDGEPEAEEGPGPRSPSRKHPCSLILGTGLPPCHAHAHSPHHSPNSSACNPTPTITCPRWRLLPQHCSPTSAKLGASLPVVQPLQHCWVSQPCPLPQDAQSRGEARDAGDAGSGEEGGH